MSQFIDHFLKLSWLKLKSNFWLLLIFAASLSLRFTVPINPILGTSYDDWLGVQQAISIRNGEWLGVWDVRTLMKGPGYSIYLALVTSIGWNPVFVLHFLYLGCGALFAYHLSKSMNSEKRKSWQNLAFSIIAFNPTVFSADFSRIYRTSLSSLLILIGIFGTVLLYSNLIRPGKNKSTMYSILTSLSFGFGAITRPEARNVFLLIIIILLIFLFVTQLNSGKKGKKKQKLRHSFTIVLFLLFGFQIPTFLIQNINYSRYETYLVEDYFNGEFAHAMKIWSSVQPREDDRTYIPISLKQRELAYEASPSLRHLRDFLENNKNTWQKQTSCDQGVDCTGSSSWFPFEVRDAAVTELNIRDSAMFQNYFKKVVGELEQSCKDNSLKCGNSSIATGTLPITDLSAQRLVNAFYLVIADALSFRFQYSIQIQPDNIIESILPQWQSLIPGLAEENLKQGTSPKISEFLGYLGTAYTFGALLLILVFLTILLFRHLSTINRTRKLEEFGPLEIFISVILLATMMLLLATTALAHISFGLQNVNSIYNLALTNIYVYFLSFLLIQTGKLWRNRGAIHEEEEERQ